jgi:GTPase
MKPVIAIVGRPNVGKSTLFNRLARKRQAIVQDEPGVTRDRIYADCSWDERPFLLIDTGGFEPGSEAPLQLQVAHQVEEAIQEADLIIFLLDGLEGLLPMDREIADHLRRTAKPVFFVINKIDGEKQEVKKLEFYALGMDPLYTISAEHGRGVGDLIEEILKGLPPTPHPEERKEEAIRVALVGRPNVGKSSLLNRLLGRSRAIVDSQPGTTRDALDTPILRQGKRYIFIDTAGIRRKSRIHEPVEHYSVLRALKSLERSDVALILLDGYEGLTEQDVRIVDMAGECGRALIVLVNKWDLVEKDASTAAQYQERIYREMKQYDFVPVLFISALTGQRISNIFSLIEDVVRQYRKRIPTGDLNRWVREVVQLSPPSIFRNHPVKLYYITQTAVAPPTFVLFANAPQGVTESYRRYLARRLREKFGFEGTPLRLLIRQRQKEKTNPPRGDFRSEDRRKGKRTKR